MTPAADSLEAALGAVPLARLCLTRGVVGSYDGAYDWVRSDSTDPDEAPGEHPGSDLSDAYVIVHVADPDLIGAAVRDWMTERLAFHEPVGHTSVAHAEGYRDALSDVARRLGL